MFLGYILGHSTLMDEHGDQRYDPNSLLDDGVWLCDLRWWWWWLIDTWHTWWSTTTHYSIHQPNSALWVLHTYLIPRPSTHMYMDTSSMSEWVICWECRWWWWLIDTSHTTQPSIHTPTLLSLLGWVSQCCYYSYPTLCRYDGWTCMMIEDVAMMMMMIGAHMMVH